MNAEYYDSEPCHECTRPTGRRHSLFKIWKKYLCDECAENKRKIAYAMQMRDAGFDPATYLPKPSCSSVDPNDTRRNEHLKERMKQPEYLKPSHHERAKERSPESSDHGNSSQKRQIEEQSSYEDTLAQEIHEIEQQKQRDKEMYERELEELKKKSLETNIAIQNATKKEKQQLIQENNKFIEEEEAKRHQQKLDALNDQYDQKVHSMEERVKIKLQEQQQFLELHSADFPERESVVLQKPDGLTLSISGPGSIALAEKKMF